MRCFVGILLLLMPFIAFAADGSTRPQIQASMVVTGWIEVTPDGSVGGYALDQPDKLPQPVIDIIRKTTSVWKFKPILVDGKPVPAKTRMSLRIVADLIDRERASLHVGGAEFGRDAGLARTKEECPPGACLEYGNRHPPRYPLDMLMDRVSGTVYLVQEIDRDGHVAKQAVRQVDLHRIGTPEQMAFWRNEFAQASLKAAQDWTYHVPTSADAPAKDHWVASIPINFRLRALDRPPPHDGYGQWDVYIPGPVRDIPWSKDGATHADSDSGADAIPDNGAPFVADTRFVLLTAPHNG